MDILNKTNRDAKHPYSTEYYMCGGRALRVDEIEPSGFEVDGYDYKTEDGFDVKTFLGRRLCIFNISDDQGQILKDLSCFQKDKEKIFEEIVTKYKAVQKNGFKAIGVNPQELPEKFMGFAGGIEDFKKLAVADVLRKCYVDIARLKDDLQLISQAFEALELEFDLEVVKVEAESLLKKPEQETGLFEFDVQNAIEWLNIPADPQDEHKEDSIRM